MGNVLPSDLRLHRRYDLKGSTYCRTAGEEERAVKPHCTLKDLDVDMQVTGAEGRGSGQGPWSVVGAALVTCLLFVFEIRGLPGA